MNSTSSCVPKCKVECATKTNICCDQQAKTNPRRYCHSLLYNNSNYTLHGSNSHRPMTRMPNGNCNCEHDGELLSNNAFLKYDTYPTQSRLKTPQKKPSIQTNSVKTQSYSIVGHPSLRIYKFRLPNHLLHLLNVIVEACQEHALTLRKGWTTYLYSLTKQDIAIRDIPGLYDVARPIVSYVRRTIQNVYKAQAIKIDRNQPHVLKYSAEDGSNHTGVELHHDKCDLTANIMLSSSWCYSGGG